MSSNNFIDLTNQTFGRWTVIEKGEDYIYPKGYKDAQWLCQCSCYGNNSLKLVRGRTLKNGQSQSCGCLAREKTIERNKKYNTYDLTGEYGIGHTEEGKEFYFDLEDYDLIKDYYWRINSHGYIDAWNIYDGKKVILMHRLVMDCPENMEVDHIYHDIWDNRKEFLRIVTGSQNQMNRILQSNNTSGIKGVNWDSERNKWRVEIMIYNKKIYLGRFDNLDEAFEVRKQAEIKYFGEFNYKGKEDINMAEYYFCQVCKKYINLEIDIHRDKEGNIICNNCNSLIKND